MCIYIYVICICIIFNIYIIIYYKPLKYLSTSTYHKSNCEATYQLS